MTLWPIRLSGWEYQKVDNRTGGSENGVCLPHALGNSHFIGYSRVFNLLGILFIGYDWDLLSNPNHFIGYSKSPSQKNRRKRCHWIIQAGRHSKHCEEDQPLRGPPFPSISSHLLNCPQDLADLEDLVHLAVAGEQRSESVQLGHNASDSPQVNGGAVSGRSEQHLRRSVPGAESVVE